MKHLSFILMSYALLAGCRSSYDEAQRKPEISAKTGTANVGPIVEQPMGTTNGDTTTAVTTTPKNGTTTVSTPDPAALNVVHDGSPEELKKYNCKGKALITDTGMDDNKDGFLQDDEIQETRIDCTEVVPAVPAKP